MGNLYTIWLFNIAMEHDPYIDDVPIFCEKRIWVSMAMSNNQRVIGNL